MKNVLLTASLALAMGLATSQVATATPFTLTSDHCTGGCGTAPFGTVDVTQIGSNVQIVVDLADGPPNAVSWAQTGSADFQLFKFNATGVVVGDISVVQTFAGQTLQANTGAFNGDGTGPFSFGISCSTCGNGSLGITSNLSFTVANAVITDITAGNPLNIFVADVSPPEKRSSGMRDKAQGPLITVAEEAIPVPDFKNNRMQLSLRNYSTHEMGKDLVARLKAEAVMLGSLEGDAFDKAYMTLVTNTQQSTINLANAPIATATDPEVKAFFTDLKTVIENRLTTAQEILAKVYGDEI
jgi:hypothetical protein